MNPQEKLKRTANLLLDISSLLMVSGANTNRANVSIDRFASVLDCKAHRMISHKNIVMTLTDNKSDISFTKVQSIPSYAINFSIISAISRASWYAIDRNWSFVQIEREIEEIKAKKKYPRLLVLFAVSLAGAGFCNIFGGDYINMTVAMVSTFVGLVVLQEAHKKNFNIYFRVVLASFIASVIASFGILFEFGKSPDIALATSILFLVPGVPLINSFTDFLDNYILNGTVRFAIGLMTVLAIAIGLFGAILIFQLH